jgi:hypothetical protein
MSNKIFLSKYHIKNIIFQFLGFHRFRLFNTKLKLFCLIIILRFELIILILDFLVTINRITILFRILRLLRFIIEILFSLYF